MPRIRLNLDFMPFELGIHCASDVNNQVVEIDRVYGGRFSSEQSPNVVEDGIDLDVLPQSVQTLRRPDTPNEISVFTLLEGTPLGLPVDLIIVC